MLDQPHAGHESTTCAPTWTTLWITPDGSPGVRRTRRRSRRILPWHSPELPHKPPRLPRMPPQMRATTNGYGEATVLVLVVALQPFSARVGGWWWVLHFQRRMWLRFREHTISACIPISWSCPGKAIVLYVARLVCVTRKEWRQEPCSRSPARGAPLR